MLRRFSQRGNPLVDKDYKGNHNTIFLLGSEINYFDSLKDYVDYFSLTRSVLQLANIQSEFKDILQEIFNKLTSIEGMLIEEDVTKEEFTLEKMSMLVQNYYQYPSRKINFDVKEIEIEKVVFSEEELDAEKEKYPDKNLKLKLEDKAIYEFGEDKSKKFDNLLFSIPKKETGDLYTDLFLEMLETCTQIKLDRTLNFKNKNLMIEITKGNYPAELCVYVSKLIQLAQYIKNSTSMRDGKIHDFDSIEFEQRMEYADIILERYVIK